jgi:hypothetical protein
VGLAGGIEASGPVAAIAERLILRAAAAAQGYPLPFRNSISLPLLVYYLDGPGDPIRAIGADFDFSVGHRFSSIE